MENTQKIIEDFFNDKIQESISTGYEEILKPIRNKKKPHKHKECLEKYTKEEDVLESNQWVRNKLDKLAVLFGNDEKLSGLIDEMFNFYQEISVPNELKTKLSSTLSDYQAYI